MTSTDIRMPTALRDQLLPLLESCPQNVPDVQARFADIQQVLVPTPNEVGAPPAADEPGETDGIACFNYLYHDITRRVNERLEQNGFKDAQFLIELDVRFAWRYLTALRLWLSDSSRAPRCWSELFNRREQPDITRLQYAMAGVCNHVCYDLAAALVETLEQLQRPGLDVGDQRHDYLAINDIFFQAIPELRWHFEGRFMRLFDRMNGPLDDLAGSMAVVFSRDTAWTVAEQLWKIHDDSQAYDRELERVDDVVARLTRGLLI